jgi:hypothetical protein
MDFMAPHDSRPNPTTDAKSGISREFIHQSSPISLKMTPATLDTPETATSSRSNGKRMNNLLR